MIPILDFLSLHYFSLGDQTETFICDFSFPLACCVPDSLSGISWTSWFLGPVQLWVHLLRLEIQLAFPWLLESINGSEKPPHWGEFRCNCLPSEGKEPSAAVTGTYERCQNSTVTHSRPCWFVTSRGRAELAGRWPCWISASAYRRNAVEMKCIFCSLCTCLHRVG